MQRQGGAYVATLIEGALRDWCLEVDGRRSPVMADGRELRWIP